ncbi:MAG: hypothetical protein ACHQ53_17070, partial [Polyangiales bacterium]
MALLDLDEVHAAPEPQSALPVLEHGIAPLVRDPLAVDAKLRAPERHDFEHARPRALDQNERREALTALRPHALGQERLGHGPLAHRRRAAAAAIGASEALPAKTLAWRPPPRAVQQRHAERDERETRSAEHAPQHADVLTLSPIDAQRRYTTTSRLYVVTDPGNALV